MRSVVNVFVHRFRLAVMQLYELEPCFTEDALREQLGNLPQTLSDAYTNIFRRIPDRHRQDALRILQLLTFSSEPIDIDGVADALAFKSGLLEDTLVYSKSRRMPDSSDILQICRGFVHLSRGSQFLCDDTTPKEVQFVRLAHMSVEDYFVSDQTDVDLGGKFFEKSAHAEIAELCLAYLIHVGQQLPQEVDCGDLPQESTMRKFPFLKYAASNVLYHLLAAEIAIEKVQNQVLEVWTNQGTFHLLRKLSGQNLLQRELDSTINISAALEVRRLNYTDDIALCQMLSQVAEESLQAVLERTLWFWKLTPLHFAAEFGFVQVAEKLIREGADLEISAGNWGTPVHMAAMMKNEEMTRFLLDMGADIDTVDLCNRSMIENAIVFGVPEIARLLLQRGAKIDTLSRDVLRSAITRHGDLEMVRLLLDNGFGRHINACLGGHGPDSVVPLWSASYHGHLDIIELLLNYGADINHDYCKAPPLHGACQGNHTDAARLLVSRGAKVKSRWNLLYHAVDQVNLELFDFLHERGQPLCGPTIQLAVEKGVIAENFYEEDRFDFGECVLDFIIEIIPQSGGSYFANPYFIFLFSAIVGAIIIRALL